MYWIEELKEEKEKLFKKLNSQSSRGLGIRGSIEEVEKYASLVLLIKEFNERNHRWCAHEEQVREPR